MKFSYKYRHASFLLPFGAWRRLICIWVLLYVRRLCRLIKRTCLSMRPLLFVIVIGMLFTVVTGLIGVAIAKYTVWHESVWDLRLFYCTSIIISATSFAITAQQKHHQKLKEQEYEYFEFVYRANQFIRESVNLLGINTIADIFVTEELYSKAIDQIRGAGLAIENGGILNSHNSPAEFRKEATLIDSFLFYSTEFLNILENTKKYTNRLINEADAQTFSSYCKDACQMLRKEIFLIQCSSKNHSPVLSMHVLDFIIQISSQILLIAVSLRRPWRYEPDWSLDNEQRNILSTYGNIVGDTYNPLEYWQ